MSKNGQEILEKIPKFEVKIYRILEY